MNRRGFLSFLMGLPVVGKYWKPKYQNVSALPVNDHNWGLEFPTGGYYTADTSSLLYIKHVCTDPKCTLTNESYFFDELEGEGGLRGYLHHNFEIPLATV